MPRQHNVIVTATVTFETIVYSTEEISISAEVAGKIARGRFEEECERTLSSDRQIQIKEIQETWVETVSVPQK